VPEKTTTPESIGGKTSKNSTKKAKTTRKRATTESKMSPALAEFEKRLTEQEAQLCHAMNAVVEQARANSQAEVAQDPADQAVASYQKEILFTRGSNEHQQLQMVRQALARLHEGNFGECVNCHNEIGAKRLEALPWTPYCIECQSRLETAHAGGLEAQRRAS
jgi:DnaK suppressor protein